MVHKLFQLERSIAVGIQPINAIKKNIPESSHNSRGRKFSDCSTGPLTNAKMNATAVEIINTNPIILIIPSSVPNFPTHKINPQTANKITNSKFSQSFL